jgi:hypothetical protein
MKWLKSYKLFESNDERKEIIENIEDILIPLADSNLVYKIGEDPGTPSIFKKNDKDDRRILIDINNKEYREFNINDIQNQIIHLIRYANSVKMPISIDVELDRFAGSYDIQRIKEYKDSKFISTEEDVLEEVRNISIRLHPKE